MTSKQYQQRSKDSYALLTELLQARFGAVKEHQFTDERRWRFDYAILEHGIAIEIEGGIWGNGRHNRGKGFIADMEKYNTATMLGWRLLRFTSDQAKYKQAIIIMKVAKLINTLKDIQQANEQRQQPYVLKIYDPIGTGDMQKSAKQVKEELEEARSGGHESVQMHINSPGGNVQEGLSIYQQLKGSELKIVGYIEGMAASMASLVAMACEDLYIYPYGMMMLHDSFTQAAGNATQSRAQAKRLEKVAENLASIYAQKSGLSVEEVKQLMMAETWMTAQEAVDKGFCDGLKRVKRKYLKS